MALWRPHVPSRLVSCARCICRLGAYDLGSKFSGAKVDLYTFGSPRVSPSKGNAGLPDGSKFQVRLFSWPQHGLQHVVQHVLRAAYLTVRHGLCPVPCLMQGLAISTVLLVVLSALLPPFTLAFSMGLCAQCYLSKVVKHQLHITYKEDLVPCLPDTGLWDTPTSGVRHYIGGDYYYD